MVPVQAEGLQRLVVIVPGVDIEQAAAGGQALGGHPVPRHAVGIIGALADREVLLHLPALAPQQLQLEERIDGVDHAAGALVVAGDVGRVLAQLPAQLRGPGIAPQVHRRLGLHFTVAQRHTVPGAAEGDHVDLLPLGHLPAHGHHLAVHRLDVPGRRVAAGLRAILPGGGLKGAILGMVQHRFCGSRTGFQYENFHDLHLPSAALCG